MRKTLAIIFIIPLTVICALFAGLACVFPAMAPSTWVMRLWAKVFLGLFGIRLRVSGEHHVDRKKPCIYMSNHASLMDIPILIAALPVDLRFIFKKSLLYLPFVGQAIYLMGMIPIDRKSLSRASASLNRAGRQIRRGSHILIFPEGTRSRDGSLKSFKKGGFYLAIRESIDIVPISISNARELCGRNAFWGNAGTVSVDIQPRLDVSPFTIETRQMLVEKVHQAINSGLKKKQTNAAAFAAVDPN